MSTTLMRLVPRVTFHYFSPFFVNGIFRNREHNHNIIENSNGNVNKDNALEQNLLMKYNNNLCHDEYICKKSFDII